MIIDAFFEYLKQVYKNDSFDFIKQNLPVNSKQNAIVVVQNAGNNPNPPDFIGESEIEIVVLAKDDREAFEVSEKIAKQLTSRFMITQSYENEKYRFLSILAIKKPFKVGNNGYSYQYNLNVKVRYAELS